MTGAEAAAEQADLTVTSLDEAERARRSVEALAEILKGCQPEYKISALLFLDLLGVVRLNLDNAVDALRALVSVRSHQ